MADHAEPASVLELLADEIRRAREEAGLTQAQLGEKIHNAPTLISMFETARRRPREDLMRRIDDALGARGRLVRLWKLAKDSSAEGQLGELFDVEQRASMIRTYNPVFVPGLLQTASYARSLLNGGRYFGATDQDIESRINTRLRRQRVLAKDRPTSLWAVIDESVLHRTIGGPDVMREQLEHLLEQARLRHVSIQLMPFETEAYPGVAPMTFFDVDGATSVFLESAATGRMVSEPDEVAEYIARFDLLRAQAASLPRTERVIKARMEAL